MGRQGAIQGAVEGSRVERSDQHGFCGAGQLDPSAMCLDVDPAYMGTSALDKRVGRAFRMVEELLSFCSVSLEFEGEIERT